MVLPLWGFVHIERELLRMQHKAEKNIFIIYMLGFVILALTVALNQPLLDTPPLFGNPPDEHARFLIPQYICEYGVIPTGLEEEIRIPTYGFSYGLYNVFPYIIQGYVMRLVSLFTDSALILLYSARLVNVAFGCFMAVVVYLLGKRIFTDMRFRWLFSFAVTFLPQSIFLHTYVNTDSCCMLSTAMMVYGLVLGYQEGINRRSSLWMSAGIILCALSYYNAYGYILSCILLFLAYFLQKKDGRFVYDWKNMLKKGIFISVIVLLGIGWWFIRSYIVLDGDILGLATREKMAAMYADDIVNPLSMQTYQDRGYTIWEMIEEKNTFEAVFYGFVGAYGSMSVFGTVWLYRLYKIFFGAGVLGILYHLLNRKNRERLNGKKIFFHINMLFCIAMPMVLMLYYAYTMDYQDQGRYLLPALVPFMYYIIKGIEKLLGAQWRKYRLPGWAINAGIVICFLIIIVGTLDLIFFRALPVYTQTGMVLM